MTSPLMQFINNALRREPPVHPIDRGLARQYIKKRLAHIYPELRDDPEALERAYRTLSLEPRLGDEGDAGVYFEMILPG